jgi:TPR repeat protein
VIPAGSLLGACDPEAGAGWLRRAARQGLAEAQARLGGLYLEGRGVPVGAARAPATSMRAQSRLIAGAAG